ncbi:MAG: transporter substrate-binding domain-containing protein, partial [Oscillospiraceae bacterium]|nr:transporter substrate-binding domain-containing protein [Oscillospiraceae bacterium]
MKKMIAMMLALLMILSLCACGAKEAEAPAQEAPAAEAPAAEAPAQEAPAEEPAEEAEPTDMEYVKEKGVLVVGITDFAPMDYKNDAGEWVGFDADMAKGFAEYLG